MRFFFKLVIIAVLFSVLQMVNIFSAFGISDAYGISGTSGNSAVCAGEKVDAHLAVSYTYANAVSALIMGDRTEAARSFNHIVNNMDHEHAPSFFCLARIAAEDGDFQAALDCAQRASLSDSSNNEYRRLVAKANFHLGNLEIADKYFNTLRLAEASNQENYLYSMLIAQASGRWERIISLADTFQNNWGDDPRFAQFKHEALVAKKDFWADLQYLIHVTSVFNDEPSFRISLAEIRATLGLDSLALGDYKAAIAMDTTAAEGYIALSEYYRIKGLTSEYINTLLPAFRSGQLTDQGMAKYFTDSFFDPRFYPKYYFDIDRLAVAMLTGHPQSKVILDVYGRYLMYVGRLKEATEFFSRQIDLRPNEIELYRNLISIYMYDRQLEKACAALDSGIMAFPKDQEFRLIRPLVIFEIHGATSQVIQAVDHALRFAESDSILGSLLTMKGDVYHQMGDRKRAEANYKRALKVTPRSASLLNNYAYMISDADDGRLIEALEMAILANEIEDGNSTYLDTQAWALYRLGRYEEARVIMRKALALSSTPSRELFLHYGDILSALGDKLMARNYWRKALEAGYDGAEIEARLNSIE